MRCQVFIFLTCFHFMSLICDSYSQANDDNSLQALVQKFIAKAEVILKGNDPYNYGKASLFSNTYGTYCNASVSDLIISGGSTMNTTFLNVIQEDPNIYFGLNVTFDSLMLTGNYFLNLDVLTLLKLYGSSQWGAKASSCKINVTAAIIQVASSENILQFVDLAINFDLGNFEVDIQNILNRPAMGPFASMIINDSAPALLNSDQKLQNLLSSWGKSKLNTMAMQNKITLDFVKEFIQKFAG